MLSLRELTEWVIRKDTELGLASCQDDHRAFRQQLEDKRPLVESSLRNARQYVSGEPSGDLARNLRRELVKLSDKWNALIDRSDQLSSRFEQNMVVSYFINQINKFNKFFSVNRSSNSWK